MLGPLGVVRRIGTVCAVAALAWTAGIAGPGPTAARLALVERSIPVPAFPAGLKAPQLESSDELRSLVAADVDRDGDVDVVGLDESLDLVVWLNDGSGQLV